MFKKIFLTIAMLCIATTAQAQWVVEYSQPRIPFFTNPFATQPVYYPASNMAWRPVQSTAVTSTTVRGKATTYTAADMVLYRQRRDGTCRVVGGVKGAGQGGGGSGALIAKRKLSSGKTIGVVLTVAHIFQPASWDVIKERRITAQFRHDDNHVRLGQPIAIDWNNDIMAVAFFVHPDTPVIPLATAPPEGGKGVECFVCGYGPDGSYQCHIGPVVGYTSVSWSGGSNKSVPAKTNHRYTSSGKNQIYVASSGLRKGDSGGPMVDDTGHLIGVFWGGGGSNTYGTYVGTLNTFASKFPTTYQWACPPKYRRPTRLVPVPTPRLQPPNVAPEPPVDTDPPATDQPPTPTSIGDHKAILANLKALQERLAKVEGSQQGLLGGQNTIAEALMKMPSKEDLAGIVSRIEAIGEGQKQMTGAMAQLQAKVNEAAGKDVSITLKVESGKFISPSYVDVSVLWALQQETGIDHMVLVTDTSADHWTTRMKGEYEAAKAAFPAIVVYDVKSSGVQFKQLPQLVIYPSKPGGETVIVKGTDRVSKGLQAVTRGEMPSS